MQLEFVVCLFVFCLTPVCRVTRPHVHVTLPPVGHTADKSRKRGVTSPTLPLYVVSPRNPLFGGELSRVAINSYWGQSRTRAARRGRAADTRKTGNTPPTWKILATCRRHEKHRHRLFGATRLIIGSSEPPDFHRRHCQGFFPVFSQSFTVFPLAPLRGRMRASHVTKLPR